jgi:hypothetical protein
LRIEYWSECLKLISNLYDVSTDDHDLVVYKMGGDPEVWPPLAAISQAAMGRQGGRLNQDWLTPPFVPHCNARWIRQGTRYNLFVSNPLVTSGQNQAPILCIRASSTKKDRSRRLRCTATPIDRLQDYVWGTKLTIA